MNPPKNEGSAPRLKLTRHAGIRSHNPFDPAPYEDVDSWYESFSEVEEEGDYWHRVEVDRVPFPLWVRLGVTIEGEYFVTGMLLGDPKGEIAIGTGALNRIAVNDILDSVAKIDQADDLLLDTAHDFIGEVRRPGGQVQDSRAFQEAAEVYVLAQWGYSKALIGVVAQALGVSRATASRRVQKARDTGLVAKARAKLEALTEDQQEARGKKYGIVILPEVLRHQGRDSLPDEDGEDDG